MLNCTHVANGTDLPEIVQSVPCSVPPSPYSFRSRKSPQEDLGSGDAEE
ncbi:hypothetical protein CSIRO_2146 [Bradyrhizobiaceae bacterium SG-6C]|nr:hypothetical protein CSIRO_2146 [Bradyrhizobiaceae bacterium SG-6C]